MSRRSPPLRHPPRGVGPLVTVFVLEHGGRGCGGRPGARCLSGARGVWAEPPLQTRDEARMGKKAGGDGTDGVRQETPPPRAEALLDGPLLVGAVNYCPPIIQEWHDPTQDFTRGVTGRRLH